jgi:hypothetical protein
MECTVDDNNFDAITASTSSSSSVDSQVVVVAKADEETGKLLLPPVLPTSTLIEPVVERDPEEVDTEINDQLFLSLQKEQTLIQKYKDLLCEEQLLQVAIQEAELQSKLSMLTTEFDTIEQVKTTILSQS